MGRTGLPVRSQGSTPLLFYQMSPVLCSGWELEVGPSSSEGPQDLTWASKSQHWVGAWRDRWIDE